MSPTPKLVTRRNVILLRTVVAAAAVVAPPTELRDLWTMLVTRAKKAPLHLWHPSPTKKFPFCSMNTQLCTHTHTRTLVSVCVCVCAITDAPSSSFASWEAYLFFQPRDFNYIFALKRRPFFSFKCHQGFSPAKIFHCIISAGSGIQQISHVRFFIFFFYKNLNEWRKTPLSMSTWRSFIPFHYLAPSCGI